MRQRQHEERKKVSRERAGAFTYFILSAFLLMQACSAYEPVPVYSNYDRAWNAALRAAQDSGINLTLVDQPGGVIRGVKDGIDANITVRRQADGTTRVESSFKGELDRDPTLSRRFDAAYERNMGR